MIKEEQQQQTSASELISTEEKHNKIDDEVIGLINDSLENDTLFRRDSLLAILEFNLKNGSINLNTNSGRDIVKFKFEQSAFTLEALPRYSSFLFELNLNSFYLIDCCQANTNFPNLIYPKAVCIDISSEKFFSATDPSASSVFKLVYEHKPLVYNTVTNVILTPIKQLRSALTVKSSGLDIVFNQVTYEKVISCLQRVSRLSSEVTCTKFKTMAKLQLQQQQPISHVTNQRSSTANISVLHSMHFDFEISAPKFM